MPRRRRTAEDVASLEGMGLAIKQLRIEKGMTEEDLARRARLTRNAIGEIERASVNTKWGTLRRIATALGLALEDLLDLAEHQAPRGRRAATFDDGKPDGKHA